MKMNRSIGLAIPIFLALTFAQSARGAAEDVLVDIAIDKVKGVIKAKVIEKHRSVPPVDVDGQWVYVLPLVNYDGSRASDNFDARWSAKNFRRHRLYILNCPDEYRSKVTFKLMVDHKAGSDGDRMDGKQFGEGDIMYFDATDNYLANVKGIGPRGDGDIGHLLNKAPNAIVILVPEKMSKETAVEGLKKHFELQKK